MSTILDRAGAALANADSLAVGGFDIGKFFQNFKTLAETWGGYFLMAMGVIALIWGGWLAVQKLMTSNNQQGQSWFKIAVLIILGGALAFGGFQLVSAFGKTGKATIEKLGQGSIFLDVTTTHFQSGLGVKEFFGIGTK